jgi:4'-phosphopantetheinyl transferase EntD
MPTLTACGRATPPDRMRGTNEKRSLEFVVADVLQAAFKTLDHIHNVAFAVVSDEDPDPYKLHTDEVRALSAHACAKRRSSWARGRTAAHSALEHLGIAAAGPIISGSMGEPIWADGIVGSITHCQRCSVAAVTRSREHLSLGIDLENIDRIQEFEISSIVCRPNERAWVLAGKNSRERLGMLFSAKEALYKSLFRSHRRYIDFAEVELSWSADECSFAVVILPFHNRIQGRTVSIVSQIYGSLIFSCSVYETQ